MDFPILLEEEPDQKAESHNTDTRFLIPAFNPIVHPPDVSKLKKEYFERKVGRKMQQNSSLAERILISERNISTGMEKKLTGRQQEKDTPPRADHDPQPPQAFQQPQYDNIPVSKGKETFSVETENKQQPGEDSMKKSFIDTILGDKASMFKEKSKASKVQNPRKQKGEGSTPQKVRTKAGKGETAEKGKGKQQGKHSDVDDIMKVINERTAKLKEDLRKRMEMSKNAVPSAPPIPRSLINTFSNKCWYNVLEVSLIDGPKAINSKARQKLTEYHPDKQQDPAAKERVSQKFKECNAAKDILTNSSKKLDYDAVHLFHCPEHRKIYLERAHRLKFFVPAELIQFDKACKIREQLGK